MFTKVCAGFLSSKPMKNVILTGDCKDMLKSVPDESVDCVITSPPYFGLRDYGTATWEGGDEGCDHKGAPYASKKSGLRKDGREHEGLYANEKKVTNGVPFKEKCGKCGALRVDKQIGLEPTPAEFVESLVDVFREVRRVLKKDGTLWVNLGVTYHGSWGATSHDMDGKAKRTGNNARPPQSMPSKELKPKDLIGIPWRVAFALQADGWYLRQDIIWAKPNPMPESVTDRCTKAHEYIFLLSKSQKYYFDNEAIQEEAIWKDDRRAGEGRIHYENGKRDGADGNGQENFVAIKEKRNKRSVWSVTTKSFPGAHFATFPEDLIEPMVRAGSRVGGIVLDPFFGSGTTGVVAARLGRDYIGIELNEKYVEIAEERLGGVTRPLL